MGEPVLWREVFEPQNIQGQWSSDDDQSLDEMKNMKNRCLTKADKRVCTKE